MAVIWRAEARRQASIIINSSIRFSLAGRQVGCTIKTSLPRTLSSIWTCVSELGKVLMRILHKETANADAISCASSGLALPAISLSPLEQGAFAIIHTSRHILHVDAARVALGLRAPG